METGGAGMSGRPCKLIFCIRERGVNRMYNDMMDTIGLVEKADPDVYKRQTLLSQVITTIKDSSYLANVATIELMARIRQLLSRVGTMLR